MWTDVIQNTDEWMDMRVGRLGGGKGGIDVVMANFAKPFGNPAQAKAVKMALEKIRGRYIGNEYANSHMERGQEEEPLARREYEKTYFCEVTNGGYFTIGEDIGVSPDGLVDDDGMIEIKCVIESVHFETVRLKRFDPAYKWQLIYDLQVAGRKWIDYVQMCDAFPEGKKLFVQRLYATNLQVEFQQINTRFVEFINLVWGKIKIIREIK